MIGVLRRHPRRHFLQSNSKVLKVAFMTNVNLRSPHGDFFKKIIESIRTSGDGEGGELVLGDGEPCVVVRCDPEVVPGGGVQVQDHEVAAGLDAVGHQSPVLVVPGK